MGKLQAPKLSWKTMTYCFNDHFLAPNVHKSGDSWRFVVVMFESPEVCKEFNIEIEVYRTNAPPNSRLSAKVRCHPCSIDQTEAEMDGFGLIVPHKFMKQQIILPEEDSFKFSVSFSFF